MASKTVKDLKVGDECYLVGPYLRSYRLKVKEISFDGRYLKITFDNGFYCSAYPDAFTVRCMDHMDLFLKKEIALHELECYLRQITESIKEIRNELI